MALVPRNLLLRPFYISYNICRFWNVFSLLLDVCKTFVLLSNLINYGKRGITLDWFRSYISNREQYVCINNVNSNRKIIQCGVPQGSVSGTLLFLIFINYVTKCSNQFILYSDDSTLVTCIPGDIVTDSSELINNELKCLKKWLKSNKININGNKSQTVIKV